MSCNTLDKKELFEIIELQSKLTSTQKTFIFGVANGLIISNEIEKKDTQQHRGGITHRK